MPVEVPNTELPSIAENDLWVYDLTLKNTWNQ